MNKGEKMNKIETINFKSLMENVFGEIDVNMKNEGLVICPFHADTNPSLSINFQAQLFYCFGCNKKGSSLDLINEIWECGRSKAQSVLLGKGKLKLFNNEVEEYHEYLMENKQFQSLLTELKGLSIDTIKKYKIGYNKINNRWTIPIFNQYDRVINIRQYSNTAKSKMLNFSSQINLFPSKPITDKVYICEGEWDCMLLRQHNIEAVTTTGGASTWFDHWNEYFRGKQVFICYDGDEAGIKGAKKVATSLIPFANEVFIISMPMDTDVSDLVLKYGIEALKEQDCEKFELETIKYDELSFDSTGMSLKEVIHSFHMKWTEGVQVYKSQPQVAPDVMIDRTIEWFKSHGGKFVWDDSDDVGYLFFDGQTYLLTESSKDLRSMLQALGGLSVKTNTGKIIVEGLSIAPKFDADVCETWSWIAPNPSDPFEIYFDMHDKTTLSIKPNKVSVISSCEVPIIQFQGKRYFKTFNYLPNVDIPSAIDLLYNNCMRIFMIDDIYKDIIVCWLFCSIISSFSTVRAGLRIYGEADTGKSTILELLYVLFFGDLHGQLPYFNSAPALWRAGRTMPVLFFDNQNVTELSDSLRTFFDASATGCARVICDIDRISTISQEARSLVAMTGLDTFIADDVLTRYIEIPTDIREKGDYYGMIDRVELFKSRDKIMSAMINVIAYNIMPSYKDGQQHMKALLDKFRKGLIYKSRTSEYLLLMVMLNKQLNNYNKKYFTYSLEDWIETINKVSSQNKKDNSLTMEWWQIFYEFLQNNKFIVESSDDETGIITIALKHSVIDLKIKCVGRQIHDYSFIIDGVSASPTEQLGYFRSIAKITGAVFPFKTAQQLGYAYRQDTKLWSDSSWKKRKIKNGRSDIIEVFFPDPIVKK